MGRALLYAGPMMLPRLLTVAELATWARTEIADDDPFANAVVDAATLVVVSQCGFPVPEWTTSSAPPVARLITIQLAKRTYLNPDAVIAEGGIGPIGGDRFVEDFARTLELTPNELAKLADVDPATASASGNLWVLGVDTVGHSLDEIYLRDSDGSNWAIPFLDVDRDPYYFPLLDGTNP